MTALTGTFVAAGQSASFEPEPNSIQFNMSLWGTFSATVQLERSFDRGTTWLPLTALGNGITFSGPCTEQFEEYESAVIYRLNCTAYSSGTVNFRLSQ